MTVYNAVAEFLGTEGNVEALGHLVVGAYISKENYYGFVNAVKADDAALAIGYIFAAVSEYAAEKEVEAEPDGPFAWFYKLIKIITDFIRKVLGVKA